MIKTEKRFTNNDITITLTIVANNDISIIPANHHNLTHVAVRGLSFPAVFLLEDQTAHPLVRFQSSPGVQVLVIVVTNWPGDDCDLLSIEKLWKVCDNRLPSTVCRLILSFYFFPWILERQWNPFLPMEIMSIQISREGRMRLWLFGSHHMVGLLYYWPFIHNQWRGPQYT